MNTNTPLHTLRDKEEEGVVNEGNLFHFKYRYEKDQKPEWNSTNSTLRKHFSLSCHTKFELALILLLLLLILCAGIVG